MKKIDFERYCLRNAAGQYWLIDTRQNGISYRVPLMLNEMGAEMQRMLEDGMTIEQMSEAMSQEYGISVGEVRGDIEMSLEELKKQGYVTEE